MSTEPPYFGNGLALYSTPPLGYTIKTGTLFIVGLKGSVVPWAPAQCTTRHRNGTMGFQWLGNHDNNVLAPQLPCWIGADHRPYYRSQRMYGTHRAYTNEDTNTIVHENDAFTPGFELTRDNKIPDVILELLSSADEINWAMEAK